MFKKDDGGVLTNFYRTLSMVCSGTGWLLFIPGLNTKSNIVLGKLNCYARVGVSTLWRFISCWKNMSYGINWDKT